MGGAEVGSFGIHTTTRGPPKKYNKSVCSKFRREEAAG